MFTPEIIEKYAEVLIRVGVNVQKGQNVLIQCTPDSLDLAYACSEKALQAGAKDVHVSIRDPKIDALRAKYLSAEQCRAVPEWKKEEEDFYLRDNGVQLGLMGIDPDVMNGVPVENARAVSEAQNEIRNVVRKYIHAGTLQWTGTALPTVGWAKKVYPDMDEAQAMKHLENDIIRMMRLDCDDPVQAWADHCETLRRRAEKLNAYQFEYLHLTSELGTDLTMKLVENHIWCSAADMGEAKVMAPYIANMPTEEIFTDPDCRSVNGIAYASRPLILNGRLVKDFWIRFEDGVAVDCGASENADALEEVLYATEGSRRLGEVALVSKQSVITKMNRLFYNGLIDENAASHLAFGSSFPTNVRGGTDMSEEELLSVGVNIASSHHDFMVGTEHYHVEGITHDGKHVVIMDDGDFTW